MTDSADPGLGELLRHLVELTDGSTDRVDRIAEQLHVSRRTLHRRQY